MASRVEDQLRRIFQSRQERIQTALQQSSEERSSIHAAASRYREAERELPSVRARLGQLPAEHSAAALRRDTEAQDRIQAEHDRLIEREGELSAEMERAASALGSDPFTAESLSLQRCQRLAADEVAAAKKERDALVRVLDEAVEEIEVRSREAAALRPAFPRSTKEAS